MIEYGHDSLDRPTAETKAYNDGYAAGFDGRTFGYVGRDVWISDRDLAPDQPYPRGYADGCKARDHDEQHEKPGRLAPVGLRVIP
jgi:hypothetical protein